MSGVGLVSISGGQKPAFACGSIRRRCLSRGLNLEDLRTAIVAANVNQAKGNFDGRQQAYTIAANDQLLTAKRISEARDRVPADRPGDALRRRDGGRRRRKSAAGRLDGFHEAPGEAEEGESTSSSASTKDRS